MSEDKTANANKHISAKDFGDRFGFSKRDHFCLKKMYPDVKKTINQWHKELKDKFVYTFKKEETK